MHQLVCFVERFSSFGKAQLNGDGSENEIEIALGKGTAPRDVLKACLDSGVALSHFAVEEPSLHDVFVHLVGRQAAGAPQESQP